MAASEDLTMLELSEWTGFNHENPKDARNPIRHPMHDATTNPGIGRS